MAVVIKKGYIPVDKSRKRKYPFHLLKEGDYLSYFEWEERDRVKYAMQKFNRDTGGCLHLSRYPDGSPERKTPYVTVGWKKGDKPRSRAPGDIPAGRIIFSENNVRNIR